jgi:hypothetical protein
MFPVSTDACVFFIYVCVNFSAISVSFGERSGEWKADTRHGSE